MRRPLLLSTGLAAALILALAPVHASTASAATEPAASRGVAAAVFEPAVSKPAASRPAASRPGLSRPGLSRPAVSKPAKPVKARPFTLVGVITATPTVTTAGSATATATVTITVTVPRHGKHRVTRVSVPVTQGADVVRNGRRVAPVALQLRDRVVVLGRVTGTGVVTVTRVVARGR